MAKRLKADQEKTENTSPMDSPAHRTPHLAQMQRDAIVGIILISHRRSIGSRMLLWGSRTLLRRSRTTWRDASV